MRPNTRNISIAQSEIPGIIELFVYSKKHSNVATRLNLSADEANEIARALLSFASSAEYRVPRADVFDIDL